MTPTRQLAAIMFTDIVGYTRLMGENESKAIDLLHVNRQLHKSIISKHGGRWLKEMGDGNLASFNSAFDAVDCARDLQEQSKKSDITLRVGIHVGDVTIEKHDVIGDGVNIASRIEAMADPGGVYISESVQKAIRGNIDLNAIYIGEAQLKNVDSPIKIYALQGEDLPVPPAEKIKSLKVDEGKKKISWIQNTIYVVLTIALILTLYWFNEKKIFSPVIKNNKAIAVLPIKNTGEVIEDHFAPGLCEELTIELSKIQALRVITAQSTKRYVNTMMSMPEIANDLNVDYLIDASVEKKENRVELKVKLIGLEPYENIIWNDLFVDEYRNLFSLYNNVIKEIVEKVDIPLRESEEINLAKIIMVDPKAHDAYLKGLYHWDRLSEEDLDLAEMYFNQAIEEDPDFAPAYVGLALTWGGRMQSGLVHPSVATPKANDAAMKALQLDNDLPEIHYMLALRNTWGNWDWETAGRSFEKTLFLNPNHAKAQMYYAHYLNIINRPKEVLAHAERAFVLDPLNPLMHALYGQCLKDHGDYDKAIEVLTKARETSDDLQILITLQSVYHMKGMHDEALESWLQFYIQLGDSVVVSKLREHEASGNYKQALVDVALIFEDRYNSGLEGYTRPWSIGTKYTRSGNKEKALDYLEKAFEEHDNNMPYISTDPIFDYMRDDPRFIALIKKMNYPE